MPAHYDATEFVDTEFEEHKTLSGTASAPAPAPAAMTTTGSPARAPSSEEVNRRLLEAQGKIAELKRAHEELERERIALEETRRRQAEFQQGRSEMVAHLTRGVGLLEESEFAARREAEQMAKTLVEFRDALVKLQAIQEQHWKPDQLNVELTRALTTIENARMEWNSARLKFAVLTGDAATTNGPAKAGDKPALPLAGLILRELCRMGYALTWPLAAVGLLALVVFVILLLRGH
jgi:hypothetical protein